MIALDQLDLRPLDGLETDKLFTDKASGKDTSRPQMNAMLSFVRERDTIVCHAMDRLACNLDDLRKLVLDLVKRGVHVRFVKKSLTFTGEDSSMAHLLLSVIGAVAQFERDLIRERQREGIALAKQRKVYLGESEAFRGHRPTTSGAGSRLGKGRLCAGVRNFTDNGLRVLGREVSDAVLAALSTEASSKGKWFGIPSMKSQVRLTLQRSSPS